jgi:hypothetical protein
VVEELDSKVVEMPFEKKKLEDDVSPRSSDTI